MSEGKRVLIVLPDERRLELQVQPNLLSSDLLELVTSQVGLKEKEFFGLAYVDETGHYSWLQYDRRVLDHEFPKKNAALPAVHHHYQQQQQQLQASNNNLAGSKCAVVLYFLIKFYVESISLLRDSQTVEHFYLQLRSMVFKDQLEVSPDSVHTLAAWALQAAYGDYIDESTSRIHLRKSPFLPSSALKDHLSECEDRVIEIYRTLAGHSRGQVIVNYLARIESLPNYGVHYFGVTDKKNTPWYLGISSKGIAQYDYADRRQPRRVFQWKQLENLYFRDRKFSIEVHDPKRELHGSSCLELPDDESLCTQDALSSCTTNNPEESTGSVGRRTTVQQGGISVIVWFGQTQALTKSIWHMAISQHQFYLDRRNSKSRQLKARNLNDIALDLSKSSTSLSLSTASSNSQSNLSHSGSTLSLNGKMGGQTPEAEESEAARAARMEIVSALKARKAAMEEKLKAKLDELKKICLEEGALSGQLPPEYPLSPGEAPPTIRRRVGTSFALPENLLNRAKSSKEESLAALELEYEIQRKITSAALRLSTDANTSKSVKKQRKMMYQQSLQQLKDIETKLRTLRLAEMYNSTQAQPQVPAVTSPWSKAKKKPRPQGGDSSTNLDDEAGFIHQQQPDVLIGSSDAQLHDLYLDDLAVNLSPSTTGNNLHHNNHHHNHHQPNQQPGSTPLRRDRSLSPTSKSHQPVTAALSSAARSAPASPQKMRPGNNSSSSVGSYQHQHYANGLNHHHHHHHQVQQQQQQQHHHHNHPQIRRETSAGYVQNPSAASRSSYRNGTTKQPQQQQQYSGSSSGQTTPTYLIKDMPWDTPNHHLHHNGHRQSVPSSALCPPLVGVDPSAGGGLYNIARQRASHDFAVHASMDDLEVIGLRRLTGAANTDHQTSAQHSPATGRDSVSNHNTSVDFEWDFGDEQKQQQQQQQQHHHQSQQPQPQHVTPATRRLDHLVQQHEFAGIAEAQRRRRLLNMSMDAGIAKSCAMTSRAMIPEGSRSMDELDGPSSSTGLLTVDVIDGSSIGPRFGGRGLRKMSSSSSNQSSNINEPELTLLPSQTYPDFPDFGPSQTGRSSVSASRMETVFDVDSAVYTRQQQQQQSNHHASQLSMSTSSASIAHHSNNNNNNNQKKKEKDWYETSLDSPVLGRHSNKPPAALPSPSIPAATPVLPAAANPPTPVGPAPPANSSCSSSTCSVSSVATAVSSAAIMSNGTSTVRAQPVRLADNDHEDDFNFESVVPFESPKNLEVIAPARFEPYREISKPFETSDIYKYSAKYRQQQQQQTKGLYQPLQPLACQPLINSSGRGGSAGSHQSQHPSSSSDGGGMNNATNSGGEIHSNHQPGSEFVRSKPATLV